MADTFDPQFVKWVVQTSGRMYGPFDTEDDAQKWITVTHGQGTVRPLFPGMIA